MADRRLPKCCVRCDVPMYEVKDIQTTPGHPYEGLPRKIGPPLPEACRVTFALSDGTSCDLTICAGCLEVLTPAGFPGLWRKCLEAFAYENRIYVHLSAVQQARTPEQQAAVDADLERMAGLCLLGILASEPWSEVKRRERAEKVILGR